MLAEVPDLPDGGGRRLRDPSRVLGVHDGPWARLDFDHPQDPRGRPGDVPAQVDHHRCEHAAHQPGIRAVDDRRGLAGRVGEVEPERTSLLRQGDVAVVDSVAELDVAAVAPGAVRQLREPRSQAALRVVDDVLHGVHHGVPAELAERLQQAPPNHLDRGHLCPQVEAQQVGEARVAQVGVLDVLAEPASLEHLDRADRWAAHRRCRPRPPGPGPQSDRRRRWRAAKLRPRPRARRPRRSVLRRRRSSGGRPTT